MPPPETRRLHLFFQLLPSSADGQVSALRATILDSVSMLMSMLNSACGGGGDGNELLQLHAELQAPVGELIRTAVLSSPSHHHNEAAGGREALFDPGLRLWSSLVSGEGARWSDTTDQLMQVLVGTGDNQAAMPRIEPLLQRIDTIEQADVRADRELLLFAQCLPPL